VPDAPPILGPGGPDEASLTVEDLTVRYYGTHEDALHEVSFAVRPGELVGVAGRNGAGKSSLALATAGFIPRVVRARVAGRIDVDGDNLLGSDEAPSTIARVHRVGIVFSNPANQLSATKATVREELAFGLENLGIARDEMERRIDAVLLRLRIGHLAERSPFALSGGEQQRVAIASIVAMGMRVLVLDEPTAQLDPLSTAAVAQLLSELAAEGTAVLVAEHAPAILSRGGRTIVLEAGRVVTDDVPGRALGYDTLGPLGIRPPTLVALAEVAGVPVESSFDEAAIAAGLRRGVATRPAAHGAPLLPDVSWLPVRDHPTLDVRIEGLIHRYPGGVEAVRGVQLHIPAGESVAIVGQNGSGKTTLVKHLNGLLRPEAGRVLIGDADTARSRIHELARTVGFVFQNPDDQVFNRSVEREIRFGPRTLRLPAAVADQLVDQAMMAAGLSAMREKNPYDLNISSRKLVALASVIATDPAILVLDEPTTGQDGPGVARVGAIVDRVHGAGRTVIAITHDMEFAAQHFARIIVMRDGEVIADGPPGSVFAPDRTELLASTGLTPPPAARIAARLGLSSVPATAAALLSILGAEEAAPGS
jgi:energy-coupling factor transport system ATP-binding protein